MNINERVTEMIGSTPLMRLKRMEKRGMSGSQIIAKLEYFNPGGSAKDRSSLLAAILALAWL